MHCFVVGTMKWIKEDTPDFMTLLTSHRFTAILTRVDDK